MYLLTPYRLDTGRRQVRGVGLGGSPTSGLRTRTVLPRKVGVKCTHSSIGPVLGVGIEIGEGTNKTVLSSDDY